VSFAAITLYVASQRLFIVVSVYLVIDSVRKLLVTPSYISCAVEKVSLNESGDNYSGSLRGTICVEVTVPTLQFVVFRQHNAVTNDPNSSVANFPQFIQANVSAVHNTARPLHPSPFLIESPFSCLHSLFIAT